ncbi:MAG: alpha/beta hydrolase, partial [Bacteroidetes bacterium]|nr:alpha/beta hydrolase [Bacteroidota bacterium]
MNKIPVPNLILIVICLVFHFSLQAQPPDYKIAERPKLGLVLSGGGAKGIAHVGILKAMEQEGLRPDFITGTSMGSIIGGLYAIGYSADQLDTIIRSIDWDLILSNNIPLNFISYEEKEYYNRYLLEFPVERGKLKLPSGMIEGQMLNEVLNHYTWPANKYASFDDFPIPFRCVATDVSTGKQIVFKDGPLAEAIRASMAIPTAFTAVDLDSTLAVDGGVVNNFPVEELYKMGADVIIGVNVSEGFEPAHEVGSMAGILLQVSMIPSLERLQSQIGFCEIYIKPDLKNYGTASFSSFAEILETGYATGQQYRQAFRELAEKYRFKNKKTNQIPLVQDSVMIESICITGQKWSSDKLVWNKLGIEKDQKYSQSDIEQGVKRVYGINSFKKVNHYIHRKKFSNKYMLSIELDEKPRTLIKASLHHDNTFSTGIALNMTLRDYLIPSSRLILAGDISRNPKFRLDFLQYIGKLNSIAVSFKYNFLNEEIPAYSEGHLTDVDITTEHNFTLGFMTTQLLENSYYLGAGYMFSTLKSKFSKVIPEEIKRGTFNNVRLETGFFINTLNDRNYPISGKELHLFGKLFLYNYYKVKFEKGIDTIYYRVNGGDTLLPFCESEFNDQIVKNFTPKIYGMIQFSYLRFIPFNTRNQLIPGISAGLTLSTETNPLFDNFRIGGYPMVKTTDIRCTGLNFGEMEYANFILAGLHFQRIIFKSLFLNLGTDILLPYEYIGMNRLDTFDWEKAIEKNSMIGYGIKLSYRSYIGPISLGVSRNTRDSYFRFFFSLGFS